MCGGGDDGITRPPSAPGSLHAAAGGNAGSLHVQVGGRAMCGHLADEVSMFTYDSRQLDCETSRSKMGPGYLTAAAKAAYTPIRAPAAAPHLGQHQQQCRAQHEHQ